MGTVNNPHNYSTTSGTTPTAQITDDVDYPHTGLIKSLSQGIRGNYAIKGSATDFDITFADGGSFTTIAVTTGKAYRDGKLVTITALSATDMNTTYNSGTGAVDITPVTDDFYLMLVAKSDNTMVLRGSNAVTNRIPDYEEGDIPIAIIKVVGGSADDSAATSDRLVQFLTTSKVSNDLSIGYDNSGYTEALSVSASSGDTTIENKVQDKDIIFKVNDGGASKDILTLDGANQLVHIKTDHANNALLIESTEASGTGAPDIMFYKNRTPAGTNEDIGHVKWRGKTDSGATSDYADIYVEKQVITNGSESGKLHIRTKKAGTTRSRVEFNATHTTFNTGNQDIDHVVESVGNAHMFFVDAANDEVGIGTNSPSATLDILTGGTFRNTRLLTVSVSASTTLTEAAHAGRYNICAGNITLPSTSTAGEHYAILNTTGGNITIGRNGNNINGAGSDFTLGTFKAATCIAIGSNNWMVVG